MESEHYHHLEQQLVHVKLIQSSLNSFFPCQKCSGFLLIVFSKTGLGRLLRVEGIAQRRKRHSSVPGVTAV
jgi:ssDNA-binding Zn-finger/Zn-ribbon topoisomerase 1